MKISIKKDRKSIVNGLFLSLFALCAVMSLGACGGGDDDEDGPVVNSDILNVDNGNIIINGDELVGTIVITANCHWVIQKQAGADGDWLTVNPSEGTGNATISVTANSVNPSSTDSRKMTLVLKSDGGISRSITVTQTIASETLTISPEFLDFTNQEITKEFTITSNASWSITGVGDWLTLSPDKGKGSQTVQVTVQENHKEKKRTITLVINAVSGNLSPRNLIITQDAGTLPTVSAIQVSYPTKESVILNSSFTSDFPVSKCGFCYGTTVNPTINDLNIEQDPQDSKSSSFSQPLTDLEAGKTYYARAYAINAVGVAYSENLGFTIQAQIPGEDDNNMPNPTKKR